MGNYYGEFELMLDARRRIRIPREVIDMLGPKTDGALVLVRGRDGRAWLVSAVQFGEIILSNVARGRCNVINGATHLRCDRRRQVSLSAKVISDYSLTRELTLVGVRDHLELWNRSEWDVYMQQFLADAGEIARRAARRTRRRT